MEIVINILIPILVGTFCSYITYILTKKTKVDDSIRAFREKSYENLILNAQAFVGEESNPEEKEIFLQEMYKSWVYCSDDVVAAINEIMEYMMLSVDEKNSIKRDQTLLGNLIVAIRKDLMGKSSLVANDFQYYKVKKRQGS